MTKQCQMCKRTLAFESFPPSTEKWGGFASYCEKCNNDEVRREAHLRMRKNWHLKKVHNITIEEYEDILKEQNNVCAICKGTDKRRKLAVDHCHSSGKIRGLLCQRCNQGIGMFDDSPIRMKEAILYLQR